MNQMCGSVNFALIALDGSVTYIISHASVSFHIYLSPYDSSHNKWNMTYNLCTEIMCKAQRDPS